MNADRHPARIVHMHIPKSAGTALHEAFLEAFKGTYRVFPHRYESEYTNVDPADFDFFSGHFGFEVASRLGGRIVTVLRDPLDRFVSTFYFLRHRYNAGLAINPKTELTARYDLRDFVRMTDEPALIVEFFNRMTWQVACSQSLDRRANYLASGRDEDDLLRQAIGNLGQCAVVGLYGEMDCLVRRIRERLGVELNLRVVNTTPGRVQVADLDPSIIRGIERWIYRDMELYAAARRMFGEPSAFSG